MALDPDSPEGKAYAKQCAARGKIRTFLMQRKFQLAMNLAQRSGLDVFAARLAPEYQHKSDPFFDELKKWLAHKDDVATKTEEIKASVPAPVISEVKKTINGWPRESSAIIWSKCPNPRFMVIQLPDGRQASMYRGQRRWAVYDKTDVKLVEWTADPIYEHIQPPAPYTQLQPTEVLRPEA